MLRLQLPGVSPKVSRRRRNCKLKQSEQHSHIREIWAVVLVGLSLLLLLSLFSYTPKDWPNSVSTVNPPVSNFIGPVGAWLAFCAFQLFGVGAWFLMGVLAVIGVLLLLQHEVQWRGKFGAGLLLLLSACCLLHVFGFPSIVERLNLPASAGGYVGFFAGGFFQHTVGKPGTFIIFGVGYIISLILLINFRPSYWVALLVTSCQDLWTGLRGTPKRDVGRELTEKERDIRVQEYVVERELAKKEKEAKKLEAEPKPVIPVPEPKFFDSTAPRPASEPVIKEVKEKKPKAEPTAVASPPPPPAPATPAAVTPPPAALPPIPKPKRERPPEIEKSVLGGATAGEGEQFVLPPFSLLEKPPEPAARNIVDDLKASAKVLKDTVREFDIEVESGDVTKGPTVTLFELHPAPGVRVEKIAALSNNIAMAMRAEKVRILAPVPGKGTVGVEVPNLSRTTVYLRDMLESPEWKSHKGGIPVAVGRDVNGHSIIGDLAQMPHLLIAGATGSGKTVCVNAILASLLYRYTAEDLRLVLIDPKMVEMQHYNTLPHLVVPVVTEAKKVPLALGWVIREMEKRFQIFAKVGARNITGFNARDRKPVAPPAADKLEQEELPIEVPRDFDIIIPDKLPFIVVVVDELADLMITIGKDVEMAIQRLTQLGRAAGIHLIVATQRPSVNVVTGVIKANIPARIAFQVASMQDSRVILDSPGAEKLLGKGDMLYEPGSGKAVRAQGVLVLDKEINDIVDFISAKAKPKFEPELEQKLKRGATNLPEVEEDDADEELIEQCIEIIRQSNRASVSVLQRRLRIGYTRAARVMDTLEERGIVGPNRGAEPREILMDLGSGETAPDEA